MGDSPDARYISVILILCYVKSVNQAEGLAFAGASTFPAPEALAMGKPHKLDRFAGIKLTTSKCSGQLIPDIALSFSSATAGASPSLN
ncbi:hypothetical protein [Burkholderia gladioli]|uniref:hypothetical protein n=1 Tax=Burkholderia gladioli TaxID=28095 RepID=UPI00163EF920|nr:hypothetical protein [Burkholderia gladioli]